MSDTDFYTLLAHRIEESGNSAPTRQDIYAAARAALKKQAVLKRPYLSVEEVRLHMAALEAAIARLEIEYADADDRSHVANGDAPGVAAYEDEPVFREQPGDADDAIPTVEADIDEAVDQIRSVNGGMAFKAREGEPELTTAPAESWSASPGVDPPHRELIVRPPRYVQNRDAAGIYDIDLIPPDSGSRRAYRPPPPPSMARRILASTALLVQLTIASLAGVAIYAFLTGQGLSGLGVGRNGAPASATVQAPQAQPSVQASAPAVIRPAEPPSEGHIALPTMFGVYAVRDGRLIEIEPAATEPVDPRAKHLQHIVKPARTTLPDGKVMFLVFRRDLIVNAPERIPVRFAARISRLMNFDPQGKVVWATPAKESWLIRDAGFDFRVMPVKESPEMVYVRPEEPGFILPAGRYALMVNNQPYDFVIEGPVTHPGHCVEGSATMRGPVFYECKPS